MSKAVLTSKPQPKEQDLQALVDAARTQAERAASSANAASKILEKAQEVEKRSVGILNEAKELREYIDGCVSASKDSAEVCISAADTVKKAVASIYHSDAIVVVPDATVFMQKSSKLFFSEKHDALMRWWDIEPNGAGSSHILRGTPKLDVPAYQGYASVELGTLFWLPDATFANSNLIGKGLMTNGSDISIEDYPALAALAAFYGLLQPISSPGRFTVNFGKTINQPFSQGSTYIVCH